METMLANLQRPFGYNSCEEELRKYGCEYRDRYFLETPFNKMVLSPDTYLIIGRRGSGKTSLTHYFCFQSEYKNSRCIDIDEPVQYQDVLNQSAGNGERITHDKLISIWTNIFWALIFDELKSESPIIRAAAIVRDNESSMAVFVRELFKGLLNKFIGNDLSIGPLNGILTKETFEAAKNESIKLSKARPLFFAIDTLERYDIENEELMNATAGLVEAAKIFNENYSKDNIYAKIFISAEIFPYIAESCIDNSLKYIQEAVYLHWKPRDLVRFACWRLYTSAKQESRSEANVFSDIDWDKFSDVYNKIWIPYFGEKLISREGQEERTFPYIMRHIQMRPRQLIVMCNAIARKCKDYLPSKNTEVITDAIHEIEYELANEVINSYSKVYKNIGHIISALSNVPMRFQGNLLDKLSHRTASEWAGNYSPLNFRQLLCEIGIIGRVVYVNKEARIIRADFEYNQEDRLYINEDTDCVIHPMFFRKLSVNTTEKWIIFPFPNTKEYEELIRG